MFFFQVFLCNPDYSSEKKLVEEKLVKRSSEKRSSEKRSSEEKPVEKLWEARGEALGSPWRSSGEALEKLWRSSGRSSGEKLWGAALGSHMPRMGGTGVRSTQLATDWL